MKHVLVLAAGLGIMLAGSASAGQIKERTTFFMVKGSTFDELDRSLGREGPQLRNGERHAGATQVTFNKAVTYKASGGSCGVDRARFGLDLHIILPRWAAPRSASAETKILWKTVRDVIAAHENQHADLARAWLKRMETTIKALPRRTSCIASEQQVEATFQKLLRAHDKAQLAFDAAETRQIDARIQRKLRDNMDRLAAR